MKKNILRLFVFLLFTVLLHEAKGQQIPDIDFKSLDGKMVNLKEITGQGKPVIISFWATWCKPCLQELGNIAEVYEEWQDNYQVSLVAVSTDDARNSAKVSSFVKAKDWPYTILLDQNSASMQQFNFTNIPFTMLVDGAGNIVYKHNSYLPGDEFSLEEELEAISQ